MLEALPDSPRTGCFPAAANVGLRLKFLNGKGEKKKPPKLRSLAGGWFAEPQSTLLLLGRVVLDQGDTALQFYTSLFLKV